MDVKPRACPYCNLIQLIHVFNIIGTVSQVECHNCGSKGPMAANETIAILRWNNLPSKEQSNGRREYESAFSRNRNIKN